MRRSILPGYVLPGGFGAEVWTFFTYSLIHANWMHYGVNMIWFLPFGSAVARRFGPWRFMAFFVVDGGGRRFRASGRLCRAERAGDRRLGRDLRHHGGRHALRLPARRAAAVSGAAATTPITACRRCRSPACCASRAVLDLPGVWFGINFLFGATSLPLYRARRRRGGGLAGPYRRLPRRPVAVFLVRSGAAICRNLGDIGAMRH